MEQLTKEQAFNNLVQAAHVGKFTLQEGEAIKQSIQVLAQVFEQFDTLVTQQEQTKESKKQKEGTV